MISSRPYPNIKALFFGKNKVFDYSLIKFYSLGREALLSGLTALNIQRGDSIVVPAYLCNSVIEPLKKYGINLIFVDVKDDLSLPLSSLKEVVKSRQIKAVLLVHYFGFTRNIDDLILFCREQNIAVIEDASHSLLSQFFGNENRYKGDIEIFSIRKSLPVIDGGALRVNIDNCKSIEIQRRRCVSIASDAVYIFKRFLEMIVVTLGVNLYGRFDKFKSKLRDQNSAKYCDINANACQPSWQLSRYLGNKFYLDRIQSRITKNFDILNDELSILGFRSFIGPLRKGLVPQAFPLYDDYGGLESYLRTNGIRAWRWPDKEIPLEILKNSDIYKNTIYFNEKLVFLPIHQSITIEQCCFMIQVLARWQSKNLKKEG